MNLKKHQNGMSFIALLLLVVIIVYTAYIALKLVPEYLEFQSVKSSVDSVAAEMEQRPLNRNQAFNLLSRKLSVGYVEINDLKQSSKDCLLPKSKRQEVFKYKHEKKVILVGMSYEKRIALFANIEVVLDFDYTKQVAAR